MKASRFLHIGLAGFFMAAATVLAAPASPQFPVVVVYATNQMPDAAATGLMPVPIFNFAIHNIAFSPDSSLLATGDGLGQVRVWNTQTGELQKSVRAHTNWAFAIVWSTDGRFLITGGGDDLVQVFDAKNPEKPLKTLRGQKGDVHALALSADSQKVFSAGDDRQIIRWDLASAVAEQTWTAHQRQIPTLALRGDGKVLASGSRDGSIRLWNPASGELLDTLIGHAEDVMCVRFSPDGTLLASASYDKTVRLWNVANGKAVHIFKGHTNRVFSVAFSPDGQRLASAGDSTVRIWNVAGQRPEKSISLGGEVLTATGSIPENLSSVAFNGDGQLLGVSSTTGASFLLSAETGQIVQQFREGALAPGQKP
jgi:WD40 repeat protein